MSRTRRTGAVVVAAATVLGLTACGGGGFDSSSSSSAAAPTSAKGPVTVKMLIGSSGATEAAAVKAATDAWAAKTGNKVEINSSASLDQDIAKGFAGGSPADLMYIDPANLSGYAKAGSLYPYGDQLGSVQYIDSLKKTFTYDGKFYCAPKDFSTLGLVINQDLWTKAGLTDADIPKDWAGLEKVATKLTSGGVVGLSMTADKDRVGAFVKQAGGWWTTEDGTAMTASSPEAVAGLTEVKKMLTNGSMKWSSDLGLGWGGDALIKGKAAMTIEGNWIHGALKDAPNLKITIAELPAGPKGKATLSFTNCWGIGAKSANQAAAIDLVKFLGTDEQQLAMSKAFGVMPATQSAMSTYTSSAGVDAAFAAGAAYAQPQTNNSALKPVFSDFTAKLATLKTADPKALLDQLQKDGDADLKG